MRSRFLRWLPAQTLRTQSTWLFLCRKYKNTTVFTTNFQGNIEKLGAQENQQLESNRREIRLKSWKGVLCLSRRLLGRKTPIITRKHASNRSRRFAAAMLNLRNGANYAVSPRHPWSSLCDRSDRNDHLETINRFDRWTILVRDRSDHMETRLYPPSPPRASTHHAQSLPFFTVLTPSSYFALIKSFLSKKSALELCFRLHYTLVSSRVRDITS